MEKLVRIVVIFLVISFILSYLNTYDERANTIGFLFGILQPFLIYSITKINFKTLQESMDIFLTVNRIVIFHNLFSLFLEYSGQQLFNISNAYGRITGIFGNTLFVVLFNVFIIPVSLYLLDKKNIKSYRIEGLFGLIVSLLVILLTASRGGLLIVLMYIMFNLFSKDRVIRKTKKIFGLFGASVFSIIIFKKLFSSTYSVLIERAFRSNFTETSRLIYQNSVINHLTENFFSFLFTGVGIDSFRYEIFNYSGFLLSSAHNFILNTMVELGIFSTIGLLFLILCLLIMKKKNFVSSTSNMILLGLLIYGLVVGGSICLLPSGTYKYTEILNLYSILLWLTIGMRIASAKTKME